MTADKKNTLGYWIGGAGTILALLVIVFKTGVFFNETKVTATEQQSLKLDISKLSDRFYSVEQKMDGVIFFVKKKFDEDSIRKVAEKEAELKYKQEVHNAVESCARH